MLALIITSFYFASEIKEAKHTRSAASPHVDSGIVARELRVVGTYCAAALTHPTQSTTIGGQLGVWSTAASVILYTEVSRMTM